MQQRETETGREAERQRGKLDFIIGEFVLEVHFQISMKYNDQQTKIKFNNTEEI